MLACSTTPSHCTRYGRTCSREFWSMWPTVIWQDSRGWLLTYFTLKEQNEFFIIPQTTCTRTPYTVDTAENNSLYTTHIITLHRVSALQAFTRTHTRTWMRWELIRNCSAQPFSCDVSAGTTEGPGRRRSFFWRCCCLQDRCRGY